MGLRILVDTNVLLDYLLCRSPYDRVAEQIVVACKQRRVSGCIAAHSRRIILLQGTVQTLRAAEHPV